MADATPEGKDPNAPKRETLRISLPPRPLKPATGKIAPTPRPNVSAATTLPMHTSSQLEPAPVSNVPPAWSTAVTKPMPSISKTTPPPAPPPADAPPREASRPSAYRCPGHRKNHAPFPAQAPIRRSSHAWRHASGAAAHRASHYWRAARRTCLGHAQCSAASRPAAREQ